VTIRTPEETLLDSLLQFDESLRAGRVPEALVLGADPDILKKLTAGQKALEILEAAVPRKARAIPSWAPERIGRFEIKSVLGSGGFAVVYLALDPDLNRQVALKVPRPHALMDPELRRRFVTEAKAVASLDHPNIISVFETGEDGDLPYLACAWCEGPTLSAWLTSRRTSVPPRLAAEIVRILTVAVQYSHSRGILHRDIKPGNVFLFPDSSQAGADFPFVPRLGDFGLAKLMETENGESLTSQLLGTPRYLAPEIVQSSSGSATEASDLYSLGATLYTLLIGRPPFESSSTPETLRLIVESDAIAPHVIDPGIGPDLSLVCLKCLEKQPEQRYESAASLAEDLARFLSGHPVKARRATRFQTLVKWSRRRPLIATLLVISAGLVATILFLAIGYTRSLQSLQSDLEFTNGQLRRNVTDLDKAVRQSESNRQRADESARHAQRLLFAADLKLASLAWHNGDAQGATRILNKHDGSEYATGDTYHFPWNYLKAHVSNPYESIQTSGQAVWALAESPAKDSIVAIGSHGLVECFSRQAPHTEVWQWQATREELGSVAWSDDQALMCTAGDHGHLAVWKADDRSLLRTLPITSPDSSLSVLFVPGSHQILVCGDDLQLSLWDGDTGLRLRDIPSPHTDSIEHMTLSPDRRLLLTTGKDGRVVVFHMADFQPIREVKFGGNPLTMSQFTADGKRMVVAWRNGTLNLCDVVSGTVLTRYSGLDAIHSVACSSNGLIVAGDRAGTVAVFDNSAIEDAIPVDTWRPINRWVAHEHPISASLWLTATEPDSGGKQEFLTADRSGAIRKWRVSKELTRKELSRRSDTFDPMPDLFAAGTEARTVLRGGRNDAGLVELNLDNLSADPRLLLPGSVTAVAQAQRSGIIVTGDSNGRVAVSGNGLPVDALPVTVFESSYVYRLCVDQLGRYATAHGYHDEMVLLDLHEQRVLLRQSNQASTCVSPDGSLFVVASHGSNELRIGSTHSLAIEAELRSHHTTVSAVLFTSDSQRLVSVSHDRTINVWDRTSWTLRHHLTGHVGRIRMAAIAPNDRIVATGDDLGIVKLWDIELGRELLQLEPLSFSEVSGLRFTVDGKSLLIWDGHSQLCLISSSAGE
jgi:serine/threonine protein kinase